MRKIIIAAAIAAVAAGAGFAQAGPQPVPNACLFAGGATSDGTGQEICSFVAADVPAHGYIGATPNDFRVVDEETGEAVVEVSPTEDFGATSGGQLDLTAGKTYRVELDHGCVEDPGCGWVGALLVG